jgi:hypothetical protein
MANVETVWSLVAKNRCFQMFSLVGHGSVLSFIVLNIVIDEVIIKVTEGQTVDFQNLSYMEMTQLYGN